MALDLLAYLLEFLLGPVFLVSHLPELPAVLGQFGEMFATLADGSMATVFEAFLAGEYDLAGQTLASLAGTLLWLAVIAAVLGQFGEVGELGEMGELFELFG